MEQISSIAQKYANLSIGIIPTNAQKIPTVQWSKFQDRIASEDEIGEIFKSDSNLAIVCGLNGLEVIDIDCKYDLTGRLFDEFRGLLKDNLPDKFEKLLISKTINSGYHIYYRCPNPSGNMKLAKRPATEDESASGEKIKVLIETRGVGGYVIAPPSKGYKFIQGKISEIPTLTEDERKLIFSIAASFNEITPDENYIMPSEELNTTPWQDYNNRADLISLLVQHGWSEVKKQGEKIFLKRPGNSTAAYSGNYHTGRKVFYVFSESTEFEANKGYSPFAVFAKLEAGDDFAKATRMALDLGYGERKNPTKQEIQPEPPKEKSYKTYISTKQSESEYLSKSKAGTLKQGLSTGFREFDTYFRLKQGNFVVINGHDNVGKSSLLIYLAAVSNVLHGWKWLMYCAENREAQVRKSLIQFKTGKAIQKLTDSEYREAEKWAYDNFVLLKNDELLDYRHLISIAEAVKEDFKYQAFLIDPYNALDVRLDKNENSHEFHYRATSVFRHFCTTSNCSIFLNCHAVTEALRKIHKDGEYQDFPMPPHKADTEGGGKFSNRADDFLTVHRYTQHPTDFNKTHIHVRKIKENETGGMPTSKDEPVILTMEAGQFGYFDSKGNNPLIEKKKETTKSLTIVK